MCVCVSERDRQGEGGGRVNVLTCLYLCVFYVLVTTNQSVGQGYFNALYMNLLLLLPYWLLHDLALPLKIEL